MFEFTVCDKFRQWGSTKSSLFLDKLLQISRHLALLRKLLLFISEFSQGKVGIAMEKVLLDVTSKS